MWGLGSRYGGRENCSVLEILFGFDSRKCHASMFSVILRIPSVAVAVLFQPRLAPYSAGLSLVFMLGISCKDM